jgi:hypothetical protein
LCSGTYLQQISVCKLGRKKYLPILGDRYWTTHKTNAAHPRNAALRQPGRCGVTENMRRDVIAWSGIGHNIGGASATCSAKCSATLAAAAFEGELKNGNGL